MRLSEAIRLGSLAIQNPKAGDARFCAIGMACRAIGQYGVNLANYFFIAANWPWIGEITSTGGGRWRIDGKMQQLTNLFDHCVCEGEMTLEALCDTVAGWERDLESKGINVEQVTMAATPETTRVPDSEHTKELELKTASR